MKNKTRRKCIFLATWRTAISGGSVGRTSRRNKFEYLTPRQYAKLREDGREENFGSAMILEWWKVYGGVQ